MYRMLIKAALVLVGISVPALAQSVVATQPAAITPLDRAMADPITREVIGSISQQGIKERQDAALAALIASYQAAKAELDWFHAYFAPKPSEQK